MDEVFVFIDTERDESIAVAVYRSLEEAIAANPPEPYAYGQWHNFKQISGRWKSTAPGQWVNTASDRYEIFYELPGRGLVQQSSLNCLGGRLIIKTRFGQYVRTRAIAMLQREDSEKPKIIEDGDYRSGNGVIARLDDELIEISAQHDSGFSSGYIRMPFVEFVEKIGVPVDLMQEAIAHQWNGDPVINQVLDAAEEFVDEWLRTAPSEETVRKLVEAVLERRGRDARK